MAGETGGNGSDPSGMTPEARALYDHEKGTRINPYEDQSNTAQKIADYMDDTPTETVSTANPQVTDDFSPLSILIQQSLRRYGNFAPGTVDGDTKLMMLEFANDTIEDLRMHPYWDNKDVPYYKSLEDKRPIPDEIMKTGLIFYYAAQQDSSKIQTGGAAYYKRMNSILYERKYGDQRIKLVPMDGGSRPLNQTMPEKAWDGMRLRDPIQNN
jgi:hypothetical protein